MEKRITKIEETTNTISGANFLVELLRESGVDTIFGYPGSPILPLYEELAKTDIKHILSRHELGAVHSAEGYAKIKNKPGVVLVTSGPGFSNTLTGIMNAYADSTPLVVIAGQVENHGVNEFQDVDIASVAKTFTKRIYQINKTSEIESSIKKAFIMANKVPKAPVIVTLKKSVLTSAVTEKSPYRIKKDIRVEAPHSCVLKAIETLKNAKTPLIIAGGGCKNYEKDLIEFAQLSHIPIVTTLMGTGIASNLSIGMIGINGNEHLNKSIENADVVLSLGVRFTNRTTMNKNVFLPNSKIININIKQNKSDNVSIHQEIIGDLDVILQQFIGTIKAKNILFDIKYNWVENLISTDKKEVINSDKFSQENILKEIYEYTKKFNPIITTDIGEHQIGVATTFKTNFASNFIISGGFGSMGFGLPAGIGAYIAKPNSLVMNITGDGSFQMNMQELGTVAEYNIPLKIFIMNNSSLGMIKTQQKKSQYKTYQSDLINPDFAKIAQSYGILGYTITNMKDLRTALKEIFTYKKAVILDIKMS